MTDKFVLDASLTLACCLGEKEAGAFAEQILESLRDGAALVPGIWPSEIANAIVKNERRGRLTASEVATLLDEIQQLPVTVFSFDAEEMFGEVAELARRCKLSVYDAEYLELARRCRLPLATLDGPLRQAAASVQVEIISP